MLIVNDRDSCEYCGKELLSKEKRKYDGYFFHAQCKAWQKERNQARKEQEKRYKEKNK